MIAPSEALERSREGVVEGRKVRTPLRESRKKVVGNAHRPGSDAGKGIAAQRQYYLVKALRVYGGKVKSVWELWILSPQLRYSIRRETD